MKKNTDKFYSNRVLEFLKLHRLSEKDSVPEPDKGCEAMLGKRWNVWRNLLRVLVTQAEIEIAIGAKAVKVTPVDILDDSKQQTTIIQSPNVTFVVDKYVTPHLFHYQDLDLHDDRTYRAFLMEFFAALQAIHVQQSARAISFLQQLPQPDQPAWPVQRCQQQPHMAGPFGPQPNIGFGYNYAGTVHPTISPNNAAIQSLLGRLVCITDLLEQLVNELVISE